MIGLSQYHQILVQNGYENIEFITDITWEDLQEIGITKLGNLKKTFLFYSLCNWHALQCYYRYKLIHHPST